VAELDAWCRARGGAALRARQRGEPYYAGNGSARFGIELLKVADADPVPENSTRVLADLSYFGDPDTAPGQRAIFTRREVPSAWRGDEQAYWAVPQPSTSAAWWGAVLFVLFIGTFILLFALGFEELGRWLKGLVQ
jgi:hypothetical protein